MNTSDRKKLNCKNQNKIIKFPIYVDCPNQDCIMNDKEINFENEQNLPELGIICSN